MSTKLIKTLSKVQKSVLKELEETKDIHLSIDKFKVSDEQLEFWRKTNFLFNKEYLKSLGITRSQERFLYVFPRKLFNVSATCRTVRIHRSTYYDWLDKSDTFRRFAHDIKEELFDNIETLMFKKALEGDNRMLIFIAKTKMRDRGYGDTPVVANVNVHLTPYEQKIQKMTIEELEAEIKLLEQK